jgi:hypothetical protein
MPYALGLVPSDEAGHSVRLLQNGLLSEGWGVIKVDISEYQRQADTTDVSSKAPWVGLMQNAFGLSEKTGEISGAIKLRLRDRGSYSASSFRLDMEKYLGEALWYLSAVATHFNADLEAIAAKNLEANRARWGQHRDEQGRLFHGRKSDLAPIGERWPERVRLEFADSLTPEQSWLAVARITVDGVAFGDPIDDNKHCEDGYRFHDILHFAFAVYLDWSPVVRSLLRNKRKSSPEEDKYEDGARARDTEEAVTNLIHGEAQRNNNFQNAKRLSSEFLSDIQLQVRDLEVRDRTAHEWEQCILSAYSIYRELLEHRGGIVNVDFQEPGLSFSPTST